jgi:serine/threonine-protein kinase
VPDHHDLDITASHAQSSPPSSATFRPANGARFAPGAVLQDRYRIVAMLGKGGMGEVYRADDLKLASSVALKLLPETLAFDPVRLDRFRSEVRLTRQISHANVCRVYDIGEFQTSAGPAVFLSMEYVDGEDLGSLLRRIGRLPEDKALQIARQICAGLHAAHEQGVIHRDLKPANIMLDGRGNARIMDFGVAGFADDLNAKGDIASGTPAYMAPEQFNRTEVSRKSDLYSLGLVLYELFTGKPAFNAQSIEELRTLHKSGTSSSLVTSPTSIVRGLDPAVERVILHCLENDPRNRPSSALAVSAALPGGDPLAAALAAGETPSPELLAVSGGEGTIPKWLAWTLAATALLAMATIAGVQDAFGIHRIAPFSYSPPVLVVKARETIEKLGVEAPKVFEAYGYSPILDIARDPKAVGGIARLKEAHPASIFFWYRAEPARTQPNGWADRGVTSNTPPRDAPNSVYVALSSSGHLMRFERIAPDMGFAAATPKQPIDWTPFFSAANFDPTSIQPATPTRTPQVGADQRFAWTARYPNRDDMAFRIEAASLAGTPVSFRIVPDTAKPTVSMEQARNDAARTVDNIVSGTMLLGIGVAVFLAFRNIRAGKSDRRGAFASGVVTGVATFVSMTVGRHTLGDMISIDIIGRPLGRSLWFGGLSWLVYLGMEPSIRKLWPLLLISWSRLMSGRWRDALVWRDLLIGATTGAAIAPLFFAGQTFDASTVSLSRPVMPTVEWFTGVPFATAALAGMVAGNFALPLLITLAMFGIHKVVRLRWITYPLTTIFLWAIVGGMSPLLGVQLAAVALAIGAMILLIRVGQLAFASCLLIGTILVNAPLTLDFNAWYAGVSLVFAAPIAAILITGARFAGRAAPTASSRA